jgi:hypothetical protein
MMLVPADTLPGLHHDAVALDPVVAGGGFDYGQPPFGYGISIGLAE